MPKSALFAFVLGIVLTTLLFSQVYKLESARDNTEFARIADMRIRIFERSLEQSVDSLRSINLLFAISSTPISAEQFHAIAQPLLADHPYIQSFVFHRYIRPGQRRAYEQAMGKRYPGFTITQLSDGRPVPATGPGPYLVSEYVEPREGNAVTIGFDSLSEPAQALAILRAVDTGLVSASGLRPLPQPDIRGKGFTLLLPVYRHAVQLSDVEARQRAFIGDTAAIFDARKFSAQIFERTGMLSRPDIDVSVYAASAPLEPDLVFRSGPPPPAARPFVPFLAHATGATALSSVSNTIYTAGRPWLIVISRAPWSAGRNVNALLVLAGGMLVTLVSVSYLQAQAGRARLVQRMVEQRTAQLHSTTEKLLLRHRAIEASANAIFITSASAPDYLIEYVNPAFERITGYPAAEIVGQSFRLLDGKDVDQPGTIELMAAMKARRESHATVRSYRKDGTMYWNEIYVAPVPDEKGEVHHFVHVNYDVTETRRYQEQLEFRANFDTLTGLANRNLLQDRLQQAISYAARYNSAVWVAFIDLDRFKFVNDSAGHASGDVLLKVVAERLKDAVRDADTIGRLGSDEFVLILPQYQSEHLSPNTIENLMAQVAKPISIGGREFFVSCSIGIAAYPGDGKTAETLLMHADIAMYRAKEMGRNNYQFFEPALNTRTQARLRIEGALRTALERNEFLLHYQPQVDLKSGKIVGAEALIRWQHPEFGMVSPLDFIGLAEETGLIIPIGAWVLRTACAQNMAWHAAGFGHLRVAVNLSGIQFAQPDIVQTIAQALDESGLDPSRLEIELTESVVMHNVEQAVTTLHALKALGIQLSVDDFGTGYSSLAYLKRFPINVLKIDQSFVRDIATNPDDATIVVSIISLAHNLRLQVIAEGVETREQLAYLRHHECDEIQGFYFSRPLAANDVQQTLDEGRGLDTENRSSASVLKRVPK
ncbi:MAG: EAL domain-containing protein [Telluria sp.]|nr:EAL domain-containing protein [Telluria sp.]